MILSHILLYCVKFILKSEIMILKSYKFRLVTAIILCILCGTEAHSQSSIVFTPQWTAQSQFAGYYVALAKGFYKEAGIDVTIKHPTASSNTLQQLTDGECNIISMNLLTAMEAKGKGMPLVNILQTSQNNTLMLVSREPINNIEELREKRVGTWKAGRFDAIARYLDKKYNYEINWITFISNINLYISGAVDATLAMSYNEFFQILSTGTSISEKNTLYFSDFGYNIPEDGLYVTADFYKKNRDLVDKFTEASKKGWLWAAEHPEETIEIVLEQARKHEIRTNKELQKWMLTKILEAQIDKASGERTFKLTDEAIELGNSILMEENLIKEKITIKQITAQ